jgi:hypothetical protein
MEKYYWNPTREDRVGVCMGIFQHDGVNRQAVENIVDTFPGQSIDFFGAMRARVYDDKVMPGAGMTQCLGLRGFVLRASRLGDLECVITRLHPSHTGSVSTCWQGPLHELAFIACNK